MDRRTWTVFVKGMGKCREAGEHCMMRSFVTYIHFISYD
jgi:hypothetical protein